MTKRNKWTDEEINILKENYSYGMKHISDMLPGHTFLSIKKKAKSLGLKVIRLITEDIKNAVKDSNSFADVFRKLNKSKSGDSYKIIKRIIEENEIDISHFNPYKNAKNLVNKEIPIEEHLTIGSKITSNNLKKKLYKYGIKQRMCEECSQNEEWRGKKIALILDHINGISNDNRLENLRILCPNCNATLETHCKGYKNIVIKTDKVKKQIEVKEEVKEFINNFGFSEEEKNSQMKQRKIERPSYNILLEEIKEMGYSKTGKKYGVSDNSIRKWKKMYEKYGDNF
jgi:5-methylcytosine-specific restriction endonuclease McrA